ncbi:hypothetical protein JG676_07535 [Campylobacter sp. 2018MI35]|uniref:hypothetical protein n=1 Tax=Campylobacter sp. 2018MI34 TaxID=2800582 RepID=UPI001904639A|nr:hypothetical protein [Campylobacter sp. 2018MI34]MBK1992438.1 hypothetical protein [Campylobacter sp. 2018MI34]
MCSSPFLDEHKMIETSYNILLLALGNSLRSYNNKIIEFIQKNNPIVISLNFYTNKFQCDFIKIKKHINKFTNLLKINFLTSSHYKISFKNTKCNILESLKEKEYFTCKLR